VHSKAHADGTKLTSSKPAAGHTSIRGKATPSAVLHPHLGITAGMQVMFGYWSFLHFWGYCTNPAGDGDQPLRLGWTLRLDSAVLHWQGAGERS